MRASALIESLQDLVEEYGDREVAIDSSMALLPVEEVDLGAEEDNAIVLWPGRVG